MGAEDDAREVVANLRFVARYLRKHDDAGLLGLAARLEEIALRLELLLKSGQDRSGSSTQEDPALITDTLIMLDLFRQIRNPALRQSVIGVVRAMRPDADDPLD